MVDFNKDNGMGPNPPQNGDNTAGYGGVRDMGADIADGGQDDRKVKSDSGSPPMKKRPKKVDINRYKDPGGLTLQKMEVGLWYVEHRRIFIKAFMLILTAIGAVSWVYTFYHVIDYVAFGIKHDNQMVAELVRPSLIGHDYLEQTGARALEFGPVQIIPEDSENTYDFLAQIKNPNKKYFATFDYYFTSGGKTYGQASGFILPEENKYLVSLAQKTEGRPNETRLYVYNLSWSRVNSHLIPDWSEYLNDHLDISISDISFTPAAETILTEKLSLNDLNFTATNNTAYNYKSVDFNIFLTGPNGIIGVNRYIMNSFKSGKTQSITITWPGKFGRVDGVVITPEIDITRDDIYLKF
jgi:hypothetical protein